MQSQQKYYTPEERLAMEEADYKSESSQGEIFAIRLESIDCELSVQQIYHRVEWDGIWANNLSVVQLGA